MEALVHNSANHKQVKEAGQKVKFVRDQELKDMFKILQLPEGRRLLWRYLSFCKVFESSFTGNSTTFFNEGARNVGLRIMADITESDPESYLKMMKEAKGE